MIWCVSYKIVFLCLFSPIPFVTGSVGSLITLATQWCRSVVSASRETKEPSAQPWRNTRSLECHNQQKSFIYSWYDQCSWLLMHMISCPWWTYTTKCHCSIYSLSTNLDVHIDFLLTILVYCDFCKCESLETTTSVLIITTCMCNIYSVVQYLYRHACNRRVIFNRFVQAYSI